MDYTILKQEIDSHPEWSDLSDNQIADKLNDLTELSLKGRRVTARTILAEIQNGAEVLDKLEAVASMFALVVAWLLMRMEDGHYSMG